MTLAVRDRVKPKCKKPPVFGAIFVYLGQLGAYLPPLTPSTTTPCPGTPQ
jgi:hypothetical protein